MQTETLTAAEKQVLTKLTQIILENPKAKSVLFMLHTKPGSYAAYRVEAKKILEVFFGPDTNNFKSQGKFNHIRFAKAGDNLVGYRFDLVVIAVLTEVNDVYHEYINRVVKLRLNPPDAHIYAMSVA